MCAANDNLALILGLAIGIPLGAIFLAVVIVLICYYCRSNGSPLIPGRTAGYTSWPTADAFSTEKETLYYGEEPKFRWLHPPDSWRGVAKFGTSSSKGSDVADQLNEAKLSQINRAVQDAPPIVSHVTLLATSLTCHLINDCSLAGIKRHV